MWVCERCGEDLYLYVDKGVVSTCCFTCDGCSGCDDPAQQPPCKPDCNGNCDDCENCKCEKKECQCPMDVLMNTGCTCGGS